MLVPKLIINTGSECWGPDENDDQTLETCLGGMQQYPFEISLKPDRHIKVCDFTFGSYQRNLRDGGKYNKNSFTGIEDELQFHTVDTRSLIKPKTNAFYRRKLQLKQTTQAFNQKQLEEEAMMLDKQKRSEQKKQKMQMQVRTARINSRHRTFNEWSIEPTPLWNVVAEIPFNQLPKQTIDLSSIVVEDLFWRGKLNYYDKSMDHVSVKMGLPLSRNAQNYDYYWASTHDDECIGEILMQIYEETDKDESGQYNQIVMAATDQILAVLMTAARSKYSWHLNITKIDNQIIIDKANGSIIDLLTVNETAPEPPMQDAENRLNRPPALGYEAVKVNQNFRQQVLLDEVAVEYPPAPFVEPNDTPASIAYRYRKITIPPRKGGSGSELLPIILITRSEVNAKLKGSDENSGFVYVCTLNEFSTKKAKPWSTQIEAQKGALLANEIRNNTTKLQRFAAQASIAGCDNLRLGYITRRSLNDVENHTILGVQSFTTDNLTSQMGLKMDNSWGIIRSFADLLINKPEGHYVLLKDPMKPIMRLYSTPENEETKDKSDDDIAN